MVSQSFYRNDRDYSKTGIPKALQIEFLTTPMSQSIDMSAVLLHYNA